LRPSTKIRERLSRIGGQAEADIDLTEAALTLSIIDRPGVSLGPYRRHLERMAEEVGLYAGGEDACRNCPIELRVEALRQVIAKRYGYAGGEDIFEDKDGANLSRVIDRRQGLPVVLGVIYIHVARALGWPIEGVDFPARFLVRLDDEGERIIVDPFDGGTVLTPRDMRGLFKAVSGNHAELSPGHYRAAGTRRILLRIQNNIKVRYLRADRLDDALETVGLMLLFAPDEAALWREAGLLSARVDRVPEAIAALEEYLRHNGSEAARYRVSILLQELRGRLS